MHLAKTLTSLCIVAFCVLPTFAQEESAVLYAHQEQAASAAAALADDEPQIAESRWRAARLEAWHLLGLLAVADDDLEAAHDAFAIASVAAVRGVHRPRVSQAVALHLLGEEADALNQLRVLSERFRTLPDAWEKLLPLLVQSGRLEEAQEKLADLRGILPRQAEALAVRLEDPASLPQISIEVGALAELKPRERKKLRRRVEKDLGEIDAALESLRKDRSQATEVFDLVESMRENHAETVENLENGWFDEVKTRVRRAEKQGAAAPEQKELLRHLQAAQSGSVRILLQLAELTRRGSSKEPISLLGQAFEAAPNSEEVLLAYGRANLEADLAFQARSALEPLAGIYSEVAEYHLLYGRALTALSSTTDAVEAFQKAVGRAPDSFDARSALGQAMNGEKRYAEAREHLQAALKMRVDDLDALAALAESEEGLGALEDAEARAQSVLEKSPGHSGAEFVLGMVRMKQGRYEEARSMLESVVESDSQSAKAHYQLSLACMRLGDRESAQRHLDLYRRAQEPQVEVMKSIYRGQPE